MKILILADLHLDEYSEKLALRALGDEIRVAAQGVDALIIAGDISDWAFTKWRDAIRWLGTLYPSSKTILLPGNHEYYGDNIEMADAQLDQLCREAGCQFGQLRTMVLGDTRILMATLWTDMRLFEAERGEASVRDAMWQARQMMPDYGQGSIVIGSPERELRPKDTIAIHECQKSWLTSQLAKPWAGQTIVVTHHAPSACVAGGMTPLSPCFASNLDDLIDRYRPAVWMFGHTHSPADLRMPGGTRLVNVSIGYDYGINPLSLKSRVCAGLVDLDQLC